MKTVKQKIFYIFLALHAILWTILQLSRNIISLDSMEAISWGELISFGTNKHPPLSGWLMAGFYNLFDRQEVLTYILGQICLIVGFIFVYKLAKFFMTKEKAFCASMILEFCFYYTYYIYVNSYNCNVLLMGLVPVVVYYFYKAVKKEKTKDWIIFGITSGLAFLGKYQIIFIFFGLFLYLLISAREQFRKKGMYLAILSGSLVILPHVIWLFQNDFFSFTYMIERSQGEDESISLLTVIFNCFKYPFKFIADQILAILPCVGAYLFLLFQTVGFSNIKTYKFKRIDLRSKETVFLLCIGVAPILIHGFMGVITSNRVPGVWGSILVCFTGILLFYLIPLDFNKNSYKYFAKWCYAALFLSLIAVGIFGVLQTKDFIAYPVEKTMTDFDRIWNKKTGDAPLKYVAGDMGYCFQFNIYNPKHPRVILQTFGHKNPWVDHDDILKSGAIIVGEDEKDVEERTRDAIYLLPQNYEIVTEKYILNACNKLGKCEEHEFYYTIIPPSDN